MGFSRDTLLRIKSEIINDPVARGYSGKTSAEISELLNTPISQSPRAYRPIFVNPHQISLILIRRNKLETVKNAADSAVASGHADAFKLFKLLELHSTSIEAATDSDIVGIVNGLVTSGVLTPADAVALRDLCRQEILRSRSDVLSVGFISEGDVVAALATE